MRILATWLALLILATPTLAQKPQFSKEQQGIWSREETYWECVKTRDVNGYLALWHEDFVGWPFFSEEPIRKDDIRRTPFRRNPNGTLQRADLQPKAVQLFGKIAVTYYLVTVTYKQEDGGTTSSTSRIMHTWEQTKDGWVIIGGMSAKVEPGGMAQ